MVKHINEIEFEHEVLKQEGVVIVDFFADWCGPCKMLAPVLENVQNEIEHVKIVKVDIDKNLQLAADYAVKNIPTLKIFKNGEEIDTKIGFLPKDAIVQMIEKNI